MFVSTFFPPCSLVSKNSHFIHNSQSKRSSSWPSQVSQSNGVRVKIKVELVLFGFHILWSLFAIIMQSSVSGIFCCFCLFFFFFVAICSGFCFQLIW
uniref:IP15808p n=1 Tax=Drosophila melanogaster TaxID=7227 RepID=A4IJ56_DROME|nr:IP15808p [Drosophila melanogaster]